MARSEKHAEAFYAASQWGNVDKARELVAKYDIDPNYVLKGLRMKETPLHYATQGGHLSMVQYLVDELHCDTSIGDKYGETALHMAASRGKIEMVKYLAEKTDIYVKSEFGDTPLHNAASSGEIEIVKYLVLEKKCDVNVVNNHNKTPLHRACERGDLEMVKVLVEELNCDTSIKGGIFSKVTPVEMALDNDNLYKTESCLDVGIYLLEREGYGELAGRVLCGACRWGRVELAKQLIERFKLNPVDAKDSGYQTAVTVVFKNMLEVKASIEIALYFLELGATSEKNKQQLFAFACFYGMLDTVKYLVKDHGIDPSGKLTELGDKNALHFAALNENNLAMVKHLVEELNVDPCVKDKDETTPLHMAAEAGRTEVVRYLAVEKKCPGDVKDKWGDTALENAKKRGHTEIVDILKDLLTSEPSEKPKVEEEKPEIPDQSHLTNDQIKEINYAARENNLEELKKLKEQYKADLRYVKDPKFSDWTPLHWASWSGAINVVKYLIEEEKVDIDQVDKYGHTAWTQAFPQINRSEGNYDVVYYFHCLGYTSSGDKAELLCGAVKHGRLELVKSLIAKHNLNPNYVRDFKGKSAMYHALDGILDDKKFLEIAMVLIEAGYKEEKDLVMVLTAACFHGENQTAEALVEKHNVDPSARTKKMGNITPFHLVCGKGDMAFVKKFVEVYKANIEMDDDKGATPFHYACQEGHMEIVTYFLNDLKYQMADELRKNVIHYASASKNLTLVKFLVEKEKFDGCAIDEKDQTPLHVAAKVGSLDIVKYLVLELKCPLNIINKNGSYADQLAYQKHDEVFEFLYPRRTNPQNY